MCKKFRFTTFGERRADASNDRGSVESALVLIPTTALFLLFLQLLVAITWRNSDLLTLQSDITKKAIGSSEFLSDHPGLTLSQKEIPGGGELIVAEKVTYFPVITPLLNIAGKFGISGAVNALKLRTIVFRE